MNYLLALDLETTGLKCNYHEITQIGAILLDRNLNEIGEFESFISINHPERGLENDFNVFKFTHIDINDLKNAPKLKQVLRKLELFTRNKTGSFDLREISIFGQNPYFDVSFLQVAYDSIGWNFPYNAVPIDLGAMYVFHCLEKTGELPMGYMKLNNICKKAGVDNKQAHNAIADIRATVDAMKSMLNIKK